MSQIFCKYTLYFYKMWLPIEIVNIIMEYAGTGQYLYYCCRSKLHRLRYNLNDARFQKLSNLYKNIDIETIGNQTTKQYVIPLRRVPSVTSRIQSIDNIQNIMVVTASEYENEVISEYYTTVIIETKQSALLL
jgi:hypothetical protein